MSDSDFCLQYKVVKSISVSENERDMFITNIIETINSQKPIKIKYLKANAPKQRRLKRKLEKNRYLLGKKLKKILIILVN